MPVNLSIKNVPDHLVDRLRRRAELAHRSMQGELMAILEATLEEQPALTPSEVLALAKTMGVETGDEATTHVRRMRDAH